MIKQLVAGAKKVHVIVFDPNERWRLTLLRNRLKLSRGRSALKAIETSSIEIEALVQTARTEPGALQLAVRKLWRSGDAQRGLSLVEEIWESEGSVSGPFALACAKTWYQYGKVAQGDVAISAARKLIPGCSEVYEVEAETHTKRGNVHRAINAAEHALRLAADEQSAAEWQLFLGKENYRLHNFEESVRHFSAVANDAMPWRRRYEFGVALVSLERAEEGRTQLLACAKTVLPRVEPGFEIAELHFKAERHHAMLLALEDAPFGKERDRLRARAMLSLGMFESCASLCLGPGRSPQLAEYGALALELAGRFEESLTVYEELARTPVHEKRRKWLLHRFSRVAYRLGRFDLTVRAELLVSGQIDDLRNLDGEVAPGFNTDVADIQTLMLQGNSEDALEALLRLEMNASSWKNISRINRLIGMLSSGSPDQSRAAKAFMKSNPFMLANAGEANAVPSALGDTERYSEALEVLEQSPEVVVYEAFHGGKTACNPLAICLDLLGRPEMQNLQHVWVLKKGAPVHEELLGRKNVHFVRHQSVGYMMRLATAGVVINNSTFPRWYSRREGQRYVNTWHGVPWKHMGNEVAADAFAYENVARNFLQASDLLFPNAYTAEKLLATQDVDALIGGAFTSIGSPRIDRMLNGTVQREQLLQKLGIPSSKPVVFYAPTWRGSMSDRDLAGAAVLEAVRELAKRDVSVVLRTHYYTPGNESFEGVPENVYLPSEAVDSNELLAISDVLVSDYSSIIFDFAVLGRPIIKHMYDFDEYRSDRGLYFTPEEVPGEVSQDATELGERLDVCLQDRNIPRNWSTLPAAHLWALEDGGATSRAVELIFNAPPLKRADNAAVLLSMNSLNANGITRSLTNLVSAVSGELGGLQIMLPARYFSNDASIQAARELRPKVPISLRSSSHLGTRQERIVWSKLQTMHESYPEGLKKWLKSRMQTEFHRTFSNTVFSAVVDFDGYDLYAAALLSYGPQQETTRVYVGHNEFAAEMSMKFPNHRGIGTVLDGFTTIAAVSEAVRDANSAELNRHFGVPKSLHAVLPNTLNVTEISEKAVLPLDSDLASWFERPGSHLIMIGRLSPEKNHLMALEALKELRVSGEEIDILVLGEGPLREELETFCEAPELVDGVFFAGQRPNPYAALSQADGLLLSSKHEGQPMVFLEAMSLGIPIAATRIPASISTLEDGRRGKLVPLTVSGLKEAIHALAKHEVAAADFDGASYLDSAVNRFLEVIGHATEDVLR